MALFIEELGHRCRTENLNIRAVASSNASENLARKAMIPLIPAAEIDRLRLTVDGADEIDRDKQMIKGGGGALLREKILASSSEEMIVIVDESKWVERLGLQPLPVEISPYLAAATLVKLRQLGLEGGLRMTAQRTPYLTDNGNWIADVDFRKAPYAPRILDALLHGVPGVLETGFFFDLAGRLLVGYADGRVMQC